jgi:hypothetical protein
MTLFEAFNFMNFVLDKDYNGQVLKPDYFNLLLQTSNLSYYKLKFGLPEEYQPGQPVPRQAVDVSRKLSDDLRNFKKESIVTVDGNNVGVFPGDYSHMDSARYGRAVTIDGNPETYWQPLEMLTSDEMASRRSNYTKRPTEKNPVGEYIPDSAGNSGIRIYPTSIAQVTFVYYRLPLKPVFAYTIVDDEIQYDSGSSVEWEWPEDCHVDLIRIMSSDMGINVREQLITEFSEMKQQKGV